MALRRGMMAASGAMKQAAAVTPAAPCSLLPRMGPFEFGAGFRALSVSSTSFARIQRSGSAPGRKRESDEAPPSPVAPPSSDEHRYVAEQRREDEDAVRVVPEEATSDLVLRDKVRSVA